MSTTKRPDNCMDHARPVPGFDGFHVCPCGNVFSTRRGDMRAVTMTVGAVYKKRLNRIKPYLRVYYAFVTDEGERHAKQPFVHRLVALTFLGPAPSPKHEVMHLDNDPKNNHVSNLRWGTHVENENQKAKHGSKILGSLSPHAKLTESKVVTVRAMFATGLMSRKQLAKHFKVSYSTPKTLSLFVRDFLCMPSFPIDRHVRRQLFELGLPTREADLIRACEEAGVSSVEVSRRLGTNRLDGGNPDWTSWKPHVSEDNHVRP